MGRFSKSSSLILMVMDWRLQVGFQRNKLGAQHSGGISYWTIKLQ